MIETGFIGVNTENILNSESVERSAAGDQPESENQIADFSSPDTDETNNSLTDDNSIETVASGKLDSNAEDEQSVKEEILYLRDFSEKAGNDSEESADGNFIDKFEANEITKDSPEIVKSDNKASSLKTSGVDLINQEENLEASNNRVQSIVDESETSAVENKSVQTTEIPANQDESNNNNEAIHDNLFPDTIVNNSENAAGNVSETISEGLFNQNSDEKYSNQTDIPEFENQNELLGQHNIVDERIEKAIDEIDALPADLTGDKEPADQEFSSDVPDNSHQPDDSDDFEATENINTFSPDKQIEEIYSNVEAVSTSSDIFATQGEELFDNKENTQPTGNSDEKFSDMRLDNTVEFEITEHGVSSNAYNNKEKDVDSDELNNEKDGSVRTNTDYSSGNEQETEENNRNRYYESDKSIFNSEDYCESRRLLLVIMSRLHLELINLIANKPYSERSIFNSDDYAESRRLLLQVVSRLPLELINLIANKPYTADTSMTNITDSKDEIGNDEIRDDIEYGSLPDIDNSKDQSADDNRVELENEHINLQIEEQVDLVSENKTKDLLQNTANNDLTNNKVSSSTDLPYDSNENGSTISLNHGSSSMIEREPENISVRGSEKIDYSVEDIEEIVEKQNSSDLNNETIENSSNPQPDSSSIQYGEQLISNKLLNQQVNDRQTVTDEKSAWIKQQSLEVTLSGRTPAYIFFDLRNEISLKNYNWQNSEDFIYSYSVYFQGITDEELKLRHKQAIPWINDQRTINSMYQMIMQDTFDHRYVMIAYAWFYRASYYYEPTSRVQFVFNACRGFFYPQEQQIVWNRLCMEAYAENNSY